jgi:Protein of unknown function (DUF2924)
MNTEKPYLIPSKREALNFDRLARMKLRELQTLYKEIFGRDAPSGNSEYARRKIVLHLQAEKEGGLPESARQHALALARNTGLRARVSANANRRREGLPLAHASTTQLVSDHDSRLPMPGSVIVARIVVRVLTSGFEYEGRRFSSLSHIARDITGTRWNGFVFFGLGKERSYGR